MRPGHPVSVTLLPIVCRTEFCRNQSSQRQKAEQWLLRNQSRTTRCRKWPAAWGQHWVQSHQKSTVSLETRPMLTGNPNPSRRSQWILTPSHRKSPKANRPGRPAAQQPKLYPQRKRPLKPLRNRNPTLNRSRSSSVTSIAASWAEKPAVESLQTCNSIVLMFPPPGWTLTWIVESEIVQPMFFQTGGADGAHLTQRRTRYLFRTSNLLRDFALPATRSSSSCYHARATEARLS